MSSLKFLAPALALALALVASAVADDDRPAVARDSLRADVEFARRKVYEALVNIGVVAQQFEGGRTQRAPGAGSGVIVSPAGHVLTNFHVAGHTTRIYCTLVTGETIEAGLVAHDPLTDLSILKLELGKRPHAGTPLPFATLGDSEALRVGDHVLAMGNPMALSSSMTLGIVSNTKRVFTDFTGSQIEDLDLGEGELTGIFTRWIQHDALILPGNSGGPLVNLQGEVVGINELGGGGVGFAIPSNLAAHVMNQALTFGEIRRAWLGLTIMPVKKLGLKRGALVAAVSPDSPAQAGGLEAGDVIVSLDGDELQVAHFEEVPVFYLAIAEREAGQVVTLEIERQGVALKKQVVLGTMEPYLGEEEEFRELGLTVRQITGPMALAKRYPSKEGVLVTGIRPGYAFESAKPQLNERDIILSVNGQVAKDLAGFAKLVESLLAAKTGKSGEWVVRFRRNDEDLMSVVTVKDEDAKKTGGELAKPWLGVRTQVLVPQVAQALGLKDKKGFRITDVFPWTKAQAADLRNGDVITHLDGQALEASRPQDAQDLRRRIEEQGIGDEVELTVLRDGQELKLKVALEETPATAAEVKTAQDKGLEFAVRNLIFMDRIERKWSKEQTGVMVTAADMGGWAHMGGLRIDDLIVSINDQPVSDVKAFESLRDTIAKEQPRVLKVFVHRGYRTHFVFIEPNWRKVQGSPEEGK